MKSPFDKLEFDIICERVAAFAASDVVASEIIKTEPEKFLDDAIKLQIHTSDALKILASSNPDLGFDDVEPIIAKARVGAILQPGELLTVKRGIAALRSLKHCVENADGCDSLKDITLWVKSCDDLFAEIDRKVETETELKDGASEKLYNLRRAITRANANLKERIDGYTRQSNISKYLRDNIVTIRDGRYVVPVRSEYRSEIKGLIHDVSSTGATVFIEPFAIVEANNALRTLVNEEQIEVERILSELGSKVVANASALSEGQRVLTECGIIFAKAAYAKSTDSFCPKLNDSGVIILNGARHPLIDPQTVVPVDVSLDKKRIILISGPNTGGKTVVLKTIGLFAAMASSGMFLPTRENSEMCVFDDIFCDIGDSQSISQSLSTFSAHMTNIADITSRMNERSLVLLDEPGDGTDPDEGAALAIGIIEKIIAARATAVITTHFNSVKEFALKSDKIENSCMQFDNNHYKPTYRLMQGVSGSSYALEIAERLGMGSDIINDARKQLSLEKIATDNVLREAERLRNEALEYKIKAEKAAVSAIENEKKAQKLKTEYEKKLGEIRDNARELIRRRADEYSEHAEKLIESIKENLKNADESALFAARKTAAAIRDGVPNDSPKLSVSAVPPEPSELRSGVRVFISGLNKEGVIVGAPKGNKVVVAIGQIKTEVPVSALTLINEHTSAPIHNEKENTAEPVTTEVMMLGMTVDEATQELDRIIADIPPKSTVRIVHGKGTGALGKGIQAFLKRNSRIKSYRYGRYGEGDTGVTIAEIK